MEELAYTERCIAYHNGLRKKEQNELLLSHLKGREYALLFVLKDVLGLPEYAPRFRDAVMNVSRGSK